MAALEDVASPACDPQEYAEGNLPPEKKSPEKSLTAVFVGKNSFNTSLAGLLHYTPSVLTSKEFDITGFYTKTTKPSTVFPLAGCCVKGRVVMWFPPGSRDDAYEGSEGEILLGRLQNTTLLQGIHNGNINNWKLQQQWVITMSAEERNVVAAKGCYAKVMSYCKTHMS